MLSPKGNLQIGTGARGDSGISPTPLLPARHLHHYRIPTPELKSSRHLGRRSNLLYPHWEPFPKRTELAQQGVIMAALQHLVLPFLTQQVSVASTETCNLPNTPRSTLHPNLPWIFMVHNFATESHGNINQG